MDEQERKLLEETYSLSKENNKMLHRIRRSQKFADFMRFMYWLVIIGISIGAFYFVQPYIEQMQNFVGKTGVNIDSFKSILPR
jgi:hypothetical protein